MVWTWSGPNSRLLGTVAAKRRLCPTFAAARGASALARPLSGGLCCDIARPSQPTRGRRSPSSRARGRGWWRRAASELDLGGYIAVTILGHAHPALVEALAAQARKLWHTSNLYQIPNQEALAARLVAASFADTVFVTSSGTEAIECAIKDGAQAFRPQGPAGAHPDHRLRGSSTAGARGDLGGGVEKMVKGFGPVVPGFDHLPFGELAAVEDASGRKRRRC